MSHLLPLVEEVQSLLQTQRFGQAMLGYEETHSTSTVAMEWAAAGAPEGSVVVADYQTAGRGRYGRTWVGSAGKNLLFSIILRPMLAPPSLGLITLATSVAIVETLRPLVAPLPVTIKWPNDVLLEGLKCCGVLMESSLTGGNVTIILGIGINLNQPSFPEELETTATSLFLQTGRLIPRAPVLASLLLNLEKAYDALQAGQVERIRNSYLQHLHNLGERVTLRFAGSERVAQGIVRGITETGGLVLDTAEGPVTFHAGELTSNPYG